MDIKNICYAAFRGFYDSIRGMLAVFTMDKEINERKSKRRSPTRTNSIRQRPLDIGEDAPRRQLKEEEESKIIPKILHCALLNGGVFLVSVLIFEYWFLPTWIRDTGEGPWPRTELFLLVIYRVFWISPLFILSKVVNAVSFQDIADLAYRHTRGRPIYAQKLSVIFADSMFSMVIQLLFLLQAVAVSYIPIYIIGYTLSFIQMCMLYSLYAFEYKWFNMGWEIHRRLSFIETNWPYFIGFGLPMAVFTELWGSFVLSGCIFSLLFPFYIISGNEASPVINSGDFPLRFFAPVVYISNCVFSRTIGSPQRNANSQTAQQRS